MHWQQARVQRASANRPDAAVAAVLQSRPIHRDWSVRPFRRLAGSAVQGIQWCVQIRNTLHFVPAAFRASERS